MKKKTLILLLTTTLVLSACSQNAAPTSQTPTENLSNETTFTDSLSRETEGGIDALDDVEINKSIFDVTLTIPKDYVGESTQEDLDKLAAEKEFQSITLNDDGSATYVMTKAQHETMMGEYRDKINSSLQELIGAEEYPNITDITANNNFTEFTITTKSTELDINESLSVIAFYMYGGMYAIFNGEKVDNISVTFINADSGEIISISNSSDM